MSDEGDAATKAPVETGAPPSSDTAAEADAAPAQASETASDEASVGPAAQRDGAEAEAGSGDDGDAAPDGAETKRRRGRRGGRRERESDDAARIAGLFTRAAGESGDRVFHFAKWSRPIKPMVMGADPESAEKIIDIFERMAREVGPGVGEEDPDFGVNLLVVLTESWAELRAAPRLDAIAPDLPRLSRMLEAADLSQHRAFNLGPDGGVRFAVVLLRYDDDLAAEPLDALARRQAVETLLLWSETAFVEESPVVLRRGGRASLKSFFVKLLRAAYHQETPLFSRDPALAAQLAARLAAEDRAVGSDAAEETVDAAGQDAPGASDSPAEPAETFEAGKSAAADAPVEGEETIAPAEVVEMSVEAAAEPAADAEPR